MAAGDLVTQGMDHWKGYEQPRENCCFILKKHEYVLYIIPSENNF